MLADDKLILIGSFSPQIAESESILKTLSNSYSVHRYDILLIADSDKTDYYYCTETVF